MIGKRQRVETTEFQKRFYPRHGFLLIEKDMVSDEWGNLSIPDSTKDRMNRYANCGTVVKLPIFRSDSEHTDYLISLVRVGDHVTFSNEIPLLAGAPPYYDVYKQGEKDRPEKDATMLIHVSDITGWILETDEVREKFEERFNDRKTAESITSDTKSTTPKAKDFFLEAKEILKEHSKNSLTLEESFRLPTLDEEIFSAT